MLRTASGLACAIVVPFVLAACAADTGDTGSTGTVGDCTSGSCGRVSGDGGSAATRDGAIGGGSRDAALGVGSHDGAVSVGGQDGGCSQDAGMYGVISSGCACVPGQSRSCYPGDPSRIGVGVCHAGMQQCAGSGEFGEWGACTGAVLPGPEVCGDGLDNNCDGRVDEGCPCLRASSTPWQMWRAPSAQCWGTTFTRHGDPGEYALSSVPSEGDPGWVGDSAVTIEFNDMSRLCGLCDCLAGGDYTYFQTTFEIPDGFAVHSLRVSVGWVDDGVRITVFNAAHPSGVVDPGSYAYLGGGSTTDLAGYIVPGHNRIVLTHVDDCCSTRGMTGVHIEFNGGALSTCPGM
jgi:hypothetical protein